MTTVQNLTELDTSACQDFSKMFNDCHALTNVNFHEGFMTENATNMSYMFASCSSIANLNVDNLITTNVQDMSGLFKDCVNITNVKLNNLITSNVIDMSEMFGGCKKWNVINISQFDTNKVTDMSAMYKDCEKLTNIIYGDNFSSSKVTTMKELFSGCKAITTAGLGIEKYLTEKVTDMSYMFDRCESVTELNVLGFVTREVTDMSYMFNECKKLEKLNLAAFKTINVTRMAHMFSSCLEIKKISVGSGSEAFNVHDVLDGGDNGVDMFRGCVKINTEGGGSGMLYDETKTSAQYALIGDIYDFPGYFSGAPECLYIASDGTEDEYSSVAVACQYASQHGGKVLMLQDKVFNYPINLSDSMTDIFAEGTFDSTHDYEIDFNNRVFTFGAELQTVERNSYYLFNSYGNISVKAKNLIIDDQGIDPSGWTEEGNVYSFAFYIGAGNVTLENVRTLLPSQRDYFFYVGSNGKDYPVKLTINNCNIETERALIFQGIRESTVTPITTVIGGKYKAKNIVEIGGVSRPNRNNVGTINFNGGEYELNNHGADDFLGLSARSVYQSATTSFIINFNGTTMSDACRRLITMDNGMNGTINVNSSYFKCLDNFINMSNKADLTVNVNSGELTSVADMFVCSGDSKLTANINGGEILTEDKIFICNEANMDIALNGGYFLGYSSISEIHNSTASYANMIYRGGYYFSYSGKDDCLQELQKHLAGGYRIIDIEGETEGKYYYRIEKIPIPGNGGGGGGFRAASKNGPKIRTTYTTKTMEDQIFIPYDYLGWEQNINTGDWKAQRIVDDHFVDCKDEIITLVKYVPAIVDGKEVFIAELRTYYFDIEGIMVTGWLQTGDGKWYYLETADMNTMGQLVKDTWIFLGGKSYRLGKNGVLYVSTVTDDGYYVNGNGELLMKAEMWYSFVAQYPIFNQPEMQNILPIILPQMFGGIIGGVAAENTISGSVTPGGRVSVGSVA